MNDTDWVGNMLIGLIGLLVAFILFLVVCAVHGAWVDHVEGTVTSGTIVKKTDRTAYFTTLWVGKVPVQQYHPETWAIVVSGKREKSGREIQALTT